MNDTDKKFFMYGVLIEVCERLDKLKPKEWDPYSNHIYFNEICEIRNTLSCLINYQEIDYIYKNKF
jgi:hypothetical protein